MTAEAEAWFLYAGNGGDPQPAQLVREKLTLATLADNEVLVAPLYGSWEGNMRHSVRRDPVDICLQRKEPRVVIGNSGVVRVLDVGANVTTLRQGDAALIFGGHGLDPFGYPSLALGFDAPGTMGCLATRSIFRDSDLLGIPKNSKFGLDQWAAFSLRYVTAWSNWELAFGTLRLLLDVNECPHPHVWGWGGGTTLAELQLARLAGCRTIMLCGNDARTEQIKRAGIAALDRRTFGDLSFDAERFRQDAEFRRSYARAEKAFLGEVSARTGAGVNIFIDNIGGPVIRVTMRALAREGVLATCGWKEGMSMSLLRATECIARHQFIHTHYARRSQALAAMTFAEANDWMPACDARVYRFDEIPQLCADFDAGTTGFFPMYRVNEE